MILSKYGTWTRNVSILRDFVRNASSWASSREIPEVASTILAWKALQVGIKHVKL